MCWWQRIFSVTRNVPGEKESGTRQAASRHSRPRSIWQAAACAENCRRATGRLPLGRRRSRLRVHTIEIASNILKTFILIVRADLGCELFHGEQNTNLLTKR